jgi:hypothetical protein
MTAMGRTFTATLQNEPGNNGPYALMGDPAQHAGHAGERIPPTPPRSTP